MANVKYTECEVWILIDEDGDYGIGKTSEDAATHYGEDVTELDGSLGTRRVCITLRVPLPTAFEITADIPCVEADPVVKVS